MKVLSMASGLVILLLGLAWIPSFAGSQSGGDKKPKHTTKQVMKEAHKSGLHKKVLKGEASQEEVEKLLGLYVSLWENKPEKGDKHSWTEKTGAVLAGTAKVLLKEEGARADLQKALNCKACHTLHK